MIKGIFYKEWLKVKLAFWLSLIAIIASCVYLFLTIRHSSNSLGAETYWFNIIYFKINYFKDLKFIAPIVGITISASQYIPEIVNKRIKLTFHLPENENIILLKMHLFGALSLVILLTVFSSLFYYINNYFLADNITLTAMESLSLWISGGFTAYFLTSAVIIESNWKFRILLITISGIIISLFYNSNIPGLHNYYGIKLLMFPILSALTIIYPATRFRKGDI